VKTLFAVLFLPLGLVLAGLVALAVMAWRARSIRQPLESNRVFTLLSVWLGCLATGLYLMATPAFGIFLSHILTGNVQGKELTNPKAVDAIVVLTGGMVDAGPIGWLPQPSSAHRLAVGYELQRLINLRIPVIISGGHTAGGQNPSEAAVAARFFAHLRTENTLTELEEASTDTYESALQLAPILAKRGIRNPLLVTSDVHMLRALATFRARGVDAIPAPAVALPAGGGIKMYLPSVTGLNLTTDAMYELYGTALYLMTGRISFADIAYTPAQQTALQQQAATQIAQPGQDLPLPSPDDKQASESLLLPPPAGSTPATPAAAPVGHEIPVDTSAAAGVQIDAPRGVDIRPVAPASAPAIQVETGQDY
jgi:uncharacterized SAM-binding protein YcdF (DUF218 family)